MERALVDRGANGGIAGSDCVVIDEPMIPRTVNCTGIGNHHLLAFLSRQLELMLSPKGEELFVSFMKWPIWGLTKPSFHPFNLKIKESRLMKKPPTSWATR